MSDLIYNHITARIPGTDNPSLINPCGMMYEEITASSLIKIDIDGNVLDNPYPDGEFGINAAGYVIHSAVHGARHDPGPVSSAFLFGGRTEPVSSRHTHRCRHDRKSGCHSPFLHITRDHAAGITHGAGAHGP